MTKEERDRSWQEVVKLIDAGEDDAATTEAKRLYRLGAAPSNTVVEKLHELLKRRPPAPAQEPTEEEKLAEAAAMIPVTVVSSHVGSVWAPTTFCAEVDSRRLFGDREDAGLAVARGAKLREMIRAHAEGIEWIRGHHDANSAEAKALLVAFSLSVDWR